MLSKGSKIYSTIYCKCPKCGEGDLFISNNPYNFNKIGEMPTNCPKCGQDFQIEPGFYMGAMYVTYAFNVAISIITFLINVLFLKIEFAYFLILLFSVILITLPLLFRTSRAMYLSFFVRFDPEAISKNKKI